MKSEEQINDRRAIENAGMRLVSGGEHADADKLEILSRQAEIKALEWVLGK